MSGKQTKITFKKEEEKKEEITLLQKKRKIPYPRTIAEKEFKISESLICRMIINDLGSFIDFRYLTDDGAYSRKGIRMRIIDFKNNLPKIQEEIEELNRLNLIK